jgi:DNA-binding Lrp family transcriptional regulator
VASCCVAGAYRGCAAAFQGICGLCPCHQPPGIAPGSGACQLGRDPIRGFPMTTCVFIQIRCKPGTTYKVAENIALREIHSELYSTSGDFDLLMKLYIPADQDVGKYINDHLLDIDGIERSLTTMTFKVF